MKLLIIRHGESEDDLINAYGGWADFPLTEKGASQVSQTATKLKTLNIPLDIILSSPLKRATSSAEILAKTLNKKMEIFEYIKERNTYGLLCGMVKSDAKQKYPWLVEALDNGQFVDGSEREEDIKNRVKKAYELITKMSYENVAIVTHGVFMKYFISEVLGKKLLKKEDAGFIYIELTNDANGIISKVEIVNSDGIEIQ